MEKAVHRPRSRSPRAQPSRREPDAAKLRRVREHVAANLARELPVAELASLARMSVSGFAHWFRRSTGVSPHAYVLGARIALAKRLLTESDRSLAAIALAVGFSSQACLNVSFRRCEGITPGAYRALGSRNAKDAATRAREDRGRRARPREHRGDSPS
jgi:AraC family transcriptional regulator